MSVEARRTTGKPEQQPLDWAALLDTALESPGQVNGVYQRFHRYSFLNQMFLLAQGCPLEPIATYQRWQNIGRQVQRGSKAFAIVRPITVKLKDQVNDQGEQKTITKFKPVNCIFPYSATEGDPLPPYEPPEWSVDRALDTLDIGRMPFEDFDGNMQGYSHGRNIAVSPVAAYPLKTTVHEMGHVVIGHTAAHETGEHMHRGVAEFQAEGTAYLVLHELDATDQMDAPASRAYVQAWLQGERPGDPEIRGVFKATDQILNAGRVAVEGSQE